MQAFECLNPTSCSERFIGVAKLFFRRRLIDEPPCEYVIDMLMAGENF